MLVWSGIGRRKVVGRRQAVGGGDGALLMSGREMRGEVAPGRAGVVRIPEEEGCLIGRGIGGIIEVSTSRMYEAGVYIS
jgi:hypothetical protein